MADTFDKKRTDHLNVIRNDWFRLDYKGYEGKSDSTKRTIIKKLLDTCNFAINPSDLSKDKLAKVGSTDEKPVMEAEVIVDGVVYVHAYYDGTNKTGEIIAGKQVCFDTVTGHAVTGIHTEWGSSEYKVVGTALVDYKEVGLARIPIRLSSTSPAPDNGVLCYANATIPGGGPNPAGEYVVTRTTDFQVVRMKEVRKADGTAPNETNIRYVLEPDSSSPIKIKVWATRGFSFNEIFVAIPEAGNTGYYLPIAQNCG
jgi:hypothetical protein